MHGVRDLEMEFEQPFRELGFSGVPHRSTAFVMPTVNCLVCPPPPSITTFVLHEHM